MQSIINPDWDFNKMGIGGLDAEFSAIFRRAFASRVFPPEVVQQLGMFVTPGEMLWEIVTSALEGLSYSMGVYWRPVCNIYFLLPSDEHLLS